MKTPFKHQVTRRLAWLSLGSAAVFSFCGCSTMIDILIDSAIDNRAQKEYERDGATPRQAQQMVFEDDFFKDVGGRP
jgi:1,6-anhydro-N-acetylmuramate kinase